MKKFAFVCAAALLGAACVGLAGCDQKYERYDGASLYSAGEPSYGAEQISSLEVDWTAGAVFVNVSDSVTEIVVEDSYKGDDDFAMRYFLDRGTLEIKFAKAGARIPSGFQKTLTITLPAAMELRDLDVETVAANVTIDGATAGEATADSVSGDIVMTGVSATVITADTVSGNVLLRGCSFLEAEAETVSGSATFVLGDIGGFRLDFESHGALNDEYGAKLLGREYVYGNGMVELNFESRSGSLTLAKAASTAD